MDSVCARATSNWTALWAPCANPVSAARLWLLTPVLQMPVLVGEVLALVADPMRPVEEIFLAVELQPVVATVALVVGAPTFRIPVPTMPIVAKAHGV
jgi:hypothetical protein